MAEIGSEEPEPVYAALWRDGLLEENEVELDVAEDRTPTVEMFTPQGMESMGINLKDMFGGMMGKKSRKKPQQRTDQRRRRRPTHLLHRRRQRPTS